MFCDLCYNNVPERNTNNYYQYVRVKDKVRDIYQFTLSKLLCFQENMLGFVKLYPHSPLFVAMFRNILNYFVVI